MNGSSMTKDPTAAQPERAHGERSGLVWDSLRIFVTSLPALTLCAISSVGIVAALRLETLPGSWLVHRLPSGLWVPVSVVGWIMLNLVVAGFYSLALQTSSRLIVSRICLALALMVAAGGLSHLFLPARFLTSAYCGNIL